MARPCPAPLRRGSTRQEAELARASTAQHSGRSAAHLSISVALVVQHHDVPVWGKQAVAAGWRAAGGFGSGRAGAAGARRRQQSALYTVYSSTPSTPLRRPACWPLVASPTPERRPAPRDGRRAAADLEVGVLEALGGGHLLGVGHLARVGRLAGHLEPRLDLRVQGSSMAAGAAMQAERLGAAASRGSAKRPQAQAHGVRVVTVGCQGRRGSRPSAATAQRPPARPACPRSGSPPRPARLPDRSAASACWPSNPWSRPGAAAACPARPPSEACLARCPHRCRCCCCWPAPAQRPAAAPPPAAAAAAAGSAARRGIPASALQGARGDGRNVGGSRRRRRRQGSSTPAHRASWTQDYMPYLCWAEGRRWQP